MSALALPPTPPSQRPRAVAGGRAAGRPPAGRPPAGRPSAGRPAADHPSAGRPARGRAHLRVVTEDFVPRPRLDEQPAALPQELRRRPGAPRPELSPNHPAVRAARRRELGAVRRHVGAAGREPVARPGAWEQVRPVAPAAVVAAPSPSRSAAPVRGAGRAQARLPLTVRRVLAAALLVIGLAVAGGAGLVVSGLLAGPVETTTTVVQEGQSLWQVAQASGSEDVAETVAQIVELNGLDSSTVHAGQTLLVPVG